MKIKVTKAMLVSYARHLAMLVVAADAATTKFTGRSMISWTKADWLWAANSLWAAGIMPLAKEWFSKNVLTNAK